MSPVTLQPTSVAEAVAGELRRRLLAGEYAPGQDLRDTELATEFGAARPTVRAAVAALVSDGLLDRGRGRSARVRAFTAADVVDIYRVRKAVEPVAVRLIVEQNRPLSGIAAAVEAFGRLGKRTPWDVAADHDVAFHSAVMDAAGAPRLAAALAGVSTELRLLIAQLQPEYDDVGQLAAEHLELQFALQSARVRPTLALWHTHLDDAEQALVRLVQERTS